MNRNDDSLDEQLRREAMAQRPAFSRELHERVMQGVRRQRTRPSWRWPVLAGAAAILICVWMLSEGREAPTPPVQITAQVQPMSLKLPPDLSVNIGGIVSARAWPPAIGVELPGIEAPESSPPPTEIKSPALPGSPEWILAGLQTPPNSAQQALAGMLPSEVRALIAVTISATE